MREMAYENVDKNSGGLSNWLWKKQQTPLHYTQAHF